MTNPEKPLTVAEVTSAIDVLIAAARAEGHAAGRAEADGEAVKALGDIVQRIDENPNEECPFCVPEPNEGGADHEPECLITAAHKALTPGGAK